MKAQSGKALVTAKVDLARPSLLATGAVPGMPDRAYVALHAAHVGADFVSLAERLGRGHLSAMLPRALCDQLGGRLHPIAPSTSMNVALAGSERPGNSEDAVATLRALGDAEIGRHRFVTPGPIRLIDSGGSFSSGTAFPQFELWLAAGAPASERHVVAFFELDPARFGGDLDWRKIADDAGLPFLDLMAQGDEEAGGGVVECAATALLPTRGGTFEALGMRGTLSRREHLVLRRGPLGSPGTPIHIHAQCVLGDALRDSSCGCGSALAAGIEQIEKVGRGAVVYHDNLLPISCPMGRGGWESLDNEIGHIVGEIGAFRPRLTSNRLLSKDLLFAAIREAEAGPLEKGWT